MLCEGGAAAEVFVRLSKGIEQSTVMPRQPSLPPPTCTEESELPESKEGEPSPGTTGHHCNSCHRHENPRTFIIKLHRDVYLSSPAQQGRYFVLTRATAPHGFEKSFMQNFYSFCFSCRFNINTCYQKDSLYNCFSLLGRSPANYGFSAMVAPTFSRVAITRLLPLCFKEQRHYNRLPFKCLSLPDTPSVTLLTSLDLSGYIFTPLPCRRCGARKVSILSTTWPTYSPSSILVGSWVQLTHGV